MAAACLRVTLEAYDGGLKHGFGKRVFLEEAEQLLVSKSNIHFPIKMDTKK